MIHKIVAARRRVAWRRRLASSVCRPEIDAGSRRALWVFDSQRGPDGYALREQMHALAKLEGLQLYAFGPFDQVPAKSLGNMRIDFEDLLASRIAEAARKFGTDLFLTGSAKGTFASAIPSFADIWEVQHGLLDPSYLPLRSNRFFVRSNSSRAILESVGYASRLTVLSDDLSPPRVEAAALSQAKSIVCFSKNPGGGCTAADLARFEQSVASVALRLGLPFELRLHPRDSRAKLIARHRGTGMLRHVTEAPSSGREGRLIISSYSTALTSESGSGDLLLNVPLTPADPIVHAEYAWVATAPLDALSGSKALAVTRRI